MSPAAIDDAVSSRRPAPSPTVLDIFVVWHPSDPIGRSVHDALFDHYHSEVFSGLAGSAVEVYGRSVPAPGSSTPPPITTRIGSAGSGPTAAHSPALFSVVLVVVGRRLVRASMENGPWREYLEDLLRLRDDDAARGKVLVLPALPRNRIESQGSPVARLMELQGVTRYVTLRQDSDGDPAAAHGALARDLGQTIVQELLPEPGDPDRLTVFVSHARDDIPRADRVSVTPHGPVAKVQALADRTRLDTFIDLHDLQGGQEWDAAIRDRARHSALLMVRTDKYASREWTQREVLEAKQADMPVVCLSSLASGEQRGSFLMDHVPTVAYPVDSTTEHDGAAGGLESRDSLTATQERAVITALNRLVDEALKRALWRHQEIPRDVEARLGASSQDTAGASSSNNDGFDAAPVHPPEPLMLTGFLTAHKQAFPQDHHLWLLHPDPPLLPPEHEIMVKLCALSGYERDQVHLLTPRTFFAAGGVWGGGEPSLTTPNLALERPLSTLMLGISMAESPDLAECGLSGRHLKVAVAEVTQMMLLAGGGITYAGALKTHALDLTAAVIDTVGRYVETAKQEQHRHSGTRVAGQRLHPGDMFTLTVPRMVLSDREALEHLARTTEAFAAVGSIDVVDEHGHLIDLDEAQLWTDRDPAVLARAYSTVRGALPHFCDARLLIGGKTIPASKVTPDGYVGGIPGIVEEALHSVRAGQPLFIAGGFGGAAAVLAHELGIGAGNPMSEASLAAVRALPAYRDAVAEIADRFDPSLTGLDAADLERLATTQRASELAGLIVRGLSAGATVAGGTDA
ncbi:toll/interleukin-1 receptor domain-containing protein [Actinomyces qiguomingii]|uniref:toll/interleukin-1 receptor domain-containing protein n=1 Tax=Actinomyces qiguomingii TaxID=2057800 RepID=UPI000FFE3E41|nr:toll/interleukin-1 receptor domain-containing protein [Actinomyces qiguomingii]